MPGKIRLPIDSVRFSREDHPDRIESPLFETENLMVNPQEYLLSVPGMGSFYAKGGADVNYRSVPGADEGWVRLYLYNQVLVALLHQRGIINFHASSFIYNGMGIMILGETGAGKSSLTLAFALREGGFMTDDITPVVFKGSVPCIMPLDRKVKIRKDTAEKLGISSSMLIDAEKGTNKKYLTLEPARKDPYPLHLIIRITEGHKEKTRFTCPQSPERFSLLRSEVCSWEILAGMPETEKAYMEQLINIIGHTGFIIAVRPPGTELNDFYEAVREEIMKYNLKSQ